MLAPLLDPTLLQLSPHRTPDYLWDEWHIRQYFYYTGKDEFERLDLLTHQANMALTLAVCEWIDAWLAPFDSDPTLQDYIEAGWAGTIDRSYSEYFMILEDQWRGPVREPKVIAIGIINEMLFEAFDAGAAPPVRAW